MTSADDCKDQEEREFEVASALRQTRRLLTLLPEIEGIPEMRRSLYLFRLFLNTVVRMN
jgi:hypothetical protein